MRVRATVTDIYEYEVNLDYYPKGATQEEILQIDKENFEMEPDLMPVMSSKINMEII